MAVTGLARVPAGASGLHRRRRAGDGDTARPSRGRVHSDPWRPCGAIAAYQAATQKLHALMAEQGIDEDEVLDEFDSARKARQRAQREAAAAS